MSRIKCFLITATDETVVVETKFGFREDTIYENVETGQRMPLRDFPAGAMWDADWYHEFESLCGNDGHSFIVRTPGGDWCIDSQASNCTRPGEKHKCWIRHGEAPNFSVDKNGDTCSAGAGSIQIGNYHGFLRKGYLED